MKLAAHIHLDAVRLGVATLLRWYPLEISEQPQIPESSQLDPHKRREFQNHWSDDWWRGVTLAKACCDHVFACHPGSTAIAVARLIAQDVGGHLPSVLPTYQALYHKLKGFIKNLVETGDPGLPEETEELSPENAGELLRDFQSLLQRQERSRDCDNRS